MKKVILTGLLVLGIVGVWFKLRSEPVYLPLPTPTTQQAQSVLVTVNFGDGKIATESAVPVEGLTAYGALEDVAKKRGWKIETKQYDFGVFVEGIDGLKGNKDRAWFYAVNWEIGDGAADKRKVKAGDWVEWHIASITPENK